MNKAEIISRHAQALKNQVGTSLAIDECEDIMASMMNEAINYTRCSTQLKDDINHDFKYWCTINRYTRIDDLTFKKGNEIINKTELYKYWRKQINPLIF